MKYSINYTLFWQISLYILSHNNFVLQYFLHYFSHNFRPRDTLCHLDRIQEKNERKKHRTMNNEVKKLLELYLSSKKP